MGYLFYGSVFVIIRRTLSHFIVHRFSFEIETHWNVRCKFGGVEFSTEMLIVKMNSCIDIYAHSCLKQFSIGRKPCSNSKTHVQIMKFTCRLNMGFGRRHWSMRRDVMCFVETKWPTLKKLRCFRWVFTFANVIFKRF